MIVQWVIVAVFVLAGLWYLKMEHHSRKMKVVIIVLIGALIYFSMINIFTSSQVDLTSPRGVVNAVYIYFGWIGQTASSLWDIGSDTVGLVGNAIKVNNTDTDQPRR
ncbi:hypothetical protein HN935_00340 [archaeon]|jgi:hypothetical protein|nr:hypothetical protein [archaeon]